MVMQKKFESGYFKPLRNANDPNSDIDWGKYHERETEFWGELERGLLELGLTTELAKPILKMINSQENCSYSGMITAYNRYKGVKAAIEYVKDNARSGDTLESKHQSGD